MKRVCWQFFALTLLLVPAMVLLSFSSINDKTINDFTLKNVNGRYVSLKNYPDAKGFIVVFTCNHCPFAKLYYGRLNELDKKYKALHVPLLAINSADTVSYEEDTYNNMAELSRQEHFSFPYLYDAMQQVAKNFAAQKTPHAFVIWKEDGKWVVKYNGAIDDNGAHPELAKAHYIANAVDDLLNGKEVTVKETKSIGCRINFRK